MTSTVADRVLSGEEAEGEIEGEEETGSEEEEDEPVKEGGVLL